LCKKSVIQHIKSLVFSLNNPYLFEPQICQYSPSHIQCRNPQVVFLYALDLLNNWLQYVWRVLVRVVHLHCNTSDQQRNKNRHPTNGLLKAALKKKMKRKIEKHHLSYQYTTKRWLHYQRISRRSKSLH
jgi:hypothetical protein